MQTQTPTTSSHKEKPAGASFRGLLRRHLTRRVGPYLLSAAAGAIVIAAIAWWNWPRGSTNEVSPDPGNSVGVGAKDVWLIQPEAGFPIPPYAAFLKDVRIVVDPGHVGQDETGRPNWKRGPTGLREAEANLRVARFLRDFLLGAGARVIMTRDEDRSLGMPDKDDLRDRAQIANRFDADLLISLHHNAGPPDANYSTVYYHASPDYSPASQCVARYLLTGLNDALRLEQFTGSGLRSDFVEYPGDGFGVLRQAGMPAVLCESSFHSNPQEERRLRDPMYNRREAYGLFLGLARWAQAGLPRVSLAPPQQVIPPELTNLPMVLPGTAVASRPPPASKPSAKKNRAASKPSSTLTMHLPPPPLTSAPAGGSVGDAFVIAVVLDDGLSKRPRTSGEVKIREESIDVRVEGKPAAYAADLMSDLLYVQVPAALKGRRFSVRVDFENVFGQHVLQPVIEVGS